MSIPLDAARRALGSQRAWLVGGALRDRLLGRETDDVDVVVEGDVAAVARRLGGEVIEHERFATAKATVGGAELDLATARTESYAHPGALPDVRPASLQEDLARRDFTINAMAIPLQGEPVLIDPHGGGADLDRRLLRVLHHDSFRDDPTRALRAARYAARFDFELEPQTDELVRRAELDAVSQDRREAELRRVAAEPAAPRALRMLSEWGLLSLRPDADRLLTEADRLLSGPPWSEVAPRAPTLLAAATGPAGAEAELAAARPSRPSDAVEMARGRTPVELALARALGAEWLDRYVSEWRSVVLEISGEDLIAAGVPEGPAVGRGLREALRRKLDGELSGPDAELEAAVEAASDG